MILVVFITFPRTSERLLISITLVDFSKYNLSDHAQTLGIDPAGELTNVGDYEHDPNTLRGFRSRKHEKIIIFSIFGGLVSSLGTLSAAPRRLCVRTYHPCYRHHRVKWHGTGLVHRSKTTFGIIDFESKQILRRGIHKIRV